MCLKAALEDGHRAQAQFLPHRGDGAAFKFGSRKYIGMERMQDYVRCAVQIEPELVGGELVAGHPVGLEAVLGMVILRNIISRFLPDRL